MAITVINSRVRACGGNASLSGGVPRFKLNYLYNFAITAENILTQLKKIGKICADAFAMDERIRFEAFDIAKAKGIELKSFSLSCAAVSFGTGMDASDYVSFFHSVQNELDLDLRSMAGNIQEVVEGARGYEIGGNILEAYQRLLLHCGTIFWVKGALEVSEKSPGFFNDPVTNNPL